MNFGRKVELGCALDDEVLEDPPVAADDGARSRGGKGDHADESVNRGHVLGVLCISRSNFSVIQDDSVEL